MSAADEVARAIEAFEGFAFNFTLHKHLRTLIAAAKGADAKDAERLDFVLAQSAFLEVSTSDAGTKTYRLLNQDEDENLIALSGDERYFKTPRAAIDAALAAKESP